MADGIGIRTARARSWSGGKAARRQERDRGLGVQQLQSELKEAQTETAQLQVQTSELRGLQKTYHAEKEDAEQKVSEVTEELGEETAQVKDLEGKLQAVHATARKLSSALQTDASALRATGASDTRALRSLRLATLSRSQKLEEEDQKLAEEDQQLAERDQKLAEEDQKLAQKEGQIQWLHGKLEEARKKEADLRRSLCKKVDVACSPAPSLAYHGKRTQLQSQEEAVRLAKSDAKAKLARASQEALLREKSAEAKTQEQLSSDQTLVQNLLRQLAATSQQRSEGEKHVRQLEEQLQMQDVEARLEKMKHLGPPHLLRHARLPQHVPTWPGEVLWQILFPPQLVQAPRQATAALGAPTKDLQAARRPSDPVAVKVVALLKRQGEVPVILVCCDAAGEFVVLSLYNADLQKLEQALVPMRTLLAVSQASYRQISVTAPRQLSYPCVIVGNPVDVSILSGASPAAPSAPFARHGMTALCLGGLLHTLPERWLIGIDETAPSIERNLARPLGADVFVTGPLAGARSWLPGLLHFSGLKAVRIEQENVTEALYSSDSPWLNLALQIAGNWLGCLERELPQSEGWDMRRRGSGLCQMYSQKQCMQMISEWETARGFTYERVIYSRPDFQWTAQHIPLAFLSSPHIWIMDGEDNGGLNDRHWAMPRSLMRAVLGSWDHVLDGTVAQMHASTGLPWWGAETFFGMRLMQLGYADTIRRLPVPAFIVCSHLHSRKEIDTSAASVNDSGRQGEHKLRYKHEHEEAQHLASCRAERPWSWRLLWECWCSIKSARGMLQFLDYELCASAWEQLVQKSASSRAKATRWLILGLCRGRAYGSGPRAKGCSGRIRIRDSAEVFSTAAERSLEAPESSEPSACETLAQCQEILIAAAREAEGSAWRQVAKAAAPCCAHWRRPELRGCGMRAALERKALLREGSWQDASDLLAASGAGRDAAAVALCSSAVSGLCKRSLWPAALVLASSGCLDLAAASSLMSCCSRERARGSRRSTSSSPFAPVCKWTPSPTAAGA
ncbi:unnamed protein product [Effrenium voratum]|nr:unnamed protein product [Effrenium voratum]